jgi:hypothetical protein
MTGALPRGFAPVAPATRVRQIIRLRRLRERYFGDDLFADPAWDMMLDLMVAHLEDKRVTVTSACAAAAVPTATALRRLKALTAKGIVERTRDPGNRRRTYLSLSEDTQSTMIRLLEGLDGRVLAAAPRGTLKAKEDRH